MKVKRAAAWSPAFKGVTGKTHRFNHSPSAGNPHFTAAYLCMKFYFNFASSRSTRASSSLIRFSCASYFISSSLIAFIIA